MNKLLSNDRGRAAVSVALVLVAMAIAHAHASEAETETPPTATPVAAVWKPQEIVFHYQSLSTYYTCQALEDRVERVLKAAGARDLDVQTSGCESGYIARMPRVRIRIISPVEATPEALRELEETRSTRELAARLRGERPPDIAEQFPATWERVALYRGKLRLDPGDCALIDQLKRYVFPKLAIRVTKDTSICVPNQLLRGHAQFEIDALKEVPRAAADDASATPPEK
ncbi:MAG TPA: hypothetical protein VIT67_03210 [Povalibacter sp.]